MASRYTPLSTLSKDDVVDVEKTILKLAVGAYIVPEILSSPKKIKNTQNIQEIKHVVRIRKMTYNVFRRRYMKPETFFCLVFLKISIFLLITLTTGYFLWPCVGFVSFTFLLIMFRINIYLKYEEYSRKYDEINEKTTLI